MRRALHLLVVLVACATCVVGRASAAGAQDEEAETPAEPEGDETIAEPEPDFAIEPAAAAEIAAAPQAEVTGAAPAPAPATSPITFNGSAEAGIEVDSNVRRVETSGFEDPQSAPMLRLAGRADASGERLGGFFTLGGGLSVRRALSGEIRSEDFAQLGLDGQWTRAMREGEVRVGSRLSLRDAYPLASTAEDRTFRSLAVEGVVVLYGGAARFTASGGPRYFKFKPSEASTWRGLGASVRGDFPLWRGGEDAEQSVDLTVTAMMEQRAYRGIAYTNICTDEDFAIDASSCFPPTARKRGDRLHRVSATLAYVGDLVASLDAVLTVLDSNSAGRSWTGVRLRGATTFEMGKLYCTLIGVLQLESYADHLLVARDQEYFEVLDNDNRSSAELRLGVPLARSLVLEARLAGWTDVSGDLEYGRTLGSVGLVWNGSD